MNNKKTVIFHVSSQEQFCGEFNEMTKIKMVKSFFRDVSHYKNFKFNYNGLTLHNEEITLKALVKGSNKIKILFTIVLTYLNSSQSFKSDSDGSLIVNNSQINFNNYSLPYLNGLNSFNNYNNCPSNEETIPISKNKFEEFQSQLKCLKEENYKKNTVNSDLNNQIQSLQKAYDFVSLQLLSANNIIENTQKENKELLDQYNNLKVNFEKNQQPFITNSLQRVSGLDKINLSEINTYRIPNLTTSTDIIKRESKKNSLLPFQNFNKSVKSNLNKSLPDRKSMLTNNNFDKSKKKSRTSNSSVEIKKQKSYLGMAKSYSMALLRKNDTFNFKQIKSDSKSHWNKVFTFLDSQDQLNFAITSRENLKKVANFWYDLNMSKIENINETLALNKQDYENIMEIQNFKLSASTNTAFKILNNSKYLEIFSYDNSYFSNPGILPIYLLLFQLSKILTVNDLSDAQSVTEFIDKFKLYVLENSKLKGFGELLKSLPSLCDFTHVNVEKIKDILKFFKITSVDSGSLGKLCKTTGILSFFVKDALLYCGQDIQEKRNKEGKDLERVNIIKDNIDIKEMKYKREKILKGLDNLFLKFNIK